MSAATGSHRRSNSGTGKLSVLLMEKCHQKAVALFEAQGFNVIQKVKLTNEEMLAIIPTIHVMGIRSKTKLPKEILEKAVNLMAIGCFCIGTDCIDLSFAASRGIPVFNSPYANSRSVAELVIAEMILLARQTGDRSMECHKGTWNKQSQGCFEVRGKTLGIIGYGHVGSQLSVLAEAMGMHVIFTDVVPQLTLGNAKQVPLDDLLAQSNFVSLHVPKLPSTENLIAAPQLAKMQKGSYLLNLSRGNVVDVDALAASLKSGHTSGCAVDVYPTEPAALTHDFVTPLQGCPNTILTPHIGGSTEEAQSGIGVEVAGKLINFINLGNTNGAKNLPHVIPAAKGLSSGSTRVCCFHKNVPGVMRDINNILADYNVTTQSLSTDEENGYMICDIGSTAGKQVKEMLTAVKSTTRNYVLFQGDGYQGEYGE